MECSIDMECSMDMDMDMQHGFAAWTWTVDMHGYMDAGMPIKSSVRHRHSGIMVSPVPLVTD